MLTISAVDFAGSILITQSRLRKRKSTKVYICVFVYLLPRLYFELAVDMSADTLLKGTNFVGGAKEISLVKNAASKESVECKFAPPHGLHFNGLCGASVKFARTVYCYCIFTLIGSRLNSFPITPIIY